MGAWSIFAVIMVNYQTLSKIINQAHLVLKIPCSRPPKRKLHNAACRPNPKVFGLSEFPLQRPSPKSDSRNRRSLIQVLSGRSQNRCHGDEQGN